jgi:hypothetical protein
MKSSMRFDLVDLRLFLLSRAGVDEAVAGFVADVGMHEPPPQEAFADYSDGLRAASQGQGFHPRLGPSPIGCFFVDPKRALSPQSRS